MTLELILLCVINKNISHAEGWLEKFNKNCVFFNCNFSLHWICMLAKYSMFSQILQISSRNQTKYWLHGQSSISRYYHLRRSWQKPKFGQMVQWDQIKWMWYQHVRHTLWKYQNFSITQIFREIIFTIFFSYHFFFHSFIHSFFFFQIKIVQRWRPMDRIWRWKLHGSKITIWVHNATTSRSYSSNYLSILWL